MDWISVKDRLPDNLQEVIVVFVNHSPESYYKSIKDKMFTGACVYYNERWYWYSSITSDVLFEYGNYVAEEVDKEIEIVYWMPLPEPPKEET